MHEVGDEANTKRSRWNSALHSDHIHSGVLKEQFKTVKGFLIGKSRQQQLIEGKEVLEAAMVFSQKGTDPSRYCERDEIHRNIKT